MLWAFNKLYEKHLEQCQEKNKRYIQVGYYDCIQPCHFTDEETWQKEVK